MKNKTCGDCKHLNRELAFCRACGAKWLKDTDGANCKYFEKITPRTVFDHITQSVETLAEKLVYQLSDGMWVAILVYDGVKFTHRETAIVATIEELKKEYKK